MARVTRLERGAPGLREATIAQLENLSAVLEREGLPARPVVLPARVPRLQVTGPSGRSEDVYAGRCEDGMWWFWWPWAQRIAVVSQVDKAVAAIARELSAPPASHDRGGIYCA
ncbi:MAG TPA: hypothetical protein VGS19_23960 [Streptosporangiaceae bacterium]|nr:hypothetical protein [Streptosporangiaceae bacterium]